MAGDLTARVFALPSPEQDAVLHDLERQGVRRTWITETVTMASSAATPDPLLISVKAVDPVGLSVLRRGEARPAAPLREALDAQSVVVSDDLLSASKRAPATRCASAARISASPAWWSSEPDRMTGSLNVGPRVMITRAGPRPHRADQRRQPRLRALSVPAAGRRPRRRAGARSR